MSKIISLQKWREENAADKERERVITALEELVWDDFDALMQLSKYCTSRVKNPIDERAKKVLIEKGFLTQSGHLKEITNQAMYVVKYGEEPPWLNKKSRV